MKVYFVRHSETEYNALNIHQDGNSELSTVGLKQAKILAKRLSKIPIDVIFTSSMKRARRTAEVVNKVLNKKIVYSDLLKERKGPTEIIGKKNTDPIVAKINKIANLHQDDPDWHYSDEENFIEFKNRVKKFLDFLTSEVKQENVLVISHGGPIKMITFLMALGDMVKPEIFYGFANTFKLYNTGITLCKKDDNGVWSVEVLNDCYHLG